MRIPRSALAAVIGMALIAPGAVAADAPIMVPVSGKTLTLSLPEKTCQYDRKEKADVKVLDALEKSDPRNQLLLAFMDCDNLKAVRGVKGAVIQPAYYGQIQSNIAGQAIADKYTREAYVAAIAGQYGKEPPEAVLARGEQTLKAMFSSRIDTGQTQTIGIIKRDKDFIQIGVIGSAPVPTPPLPLGVAPPPPAMQKIINVITLTKLGVPVAITLAHPATPDMTLQGLSDRAELYARQLISLNPENAPTILSKSLDWWSMAVGALGGMLFTIIFGMLFKRRS